MKTAAEVFSYVEKQNFHYSLMTGLIQEAIQWDDCTLDMALDFAKKSQYNNYVVWAIAHRNDCPLETMIDLAVRSDFNQDCDLSSGIVDFEEWQEASLEEQLILVTKHDFFWSLAGSVVQRNDCSLEKAVEIAEKSGYDDFVVSRVCDREDCTPAVALKLSQKIVTSTPS